MSIRIKVVPDATPNADGEWIETTLVMTSRVKWLAMEMLVKPFVPKGHHVVAVERG